MQKHSSCAGGFVALACCLIVLIAGCESAEEYKKSPPPEPVEGTVQVSGTPEEMQFMYSLAATMEGARALGASGDTVTALARVDSLVTVVESVLDTIPLDRSLSEFLTIYVADGYGTLQEWYTARHDTAAIRILTNRYQTLARDLDSRRDTVQPAP